MNYKKYTRKYVLLKENNGSIEDQRKGAKGHLRIETGNNKGAIRCQVENIKIITDEKSVFKLMLLGEKNKKLISVTLGSIAINSNGRGESYFRFLPNDINGNGDELADFTGATIITQDFKVVLKGEMQGGEEDKSFDIEKQCKREKEIHQMEKPKKKEQENSYDEKNYNSFYNSFLLNACTHLCQTADNFQDIEPFEDSKINASWKRISTVTNLPLIAPGAHYFAGKYKHYIFGAKELNENKIIDFYIGIPGRNTREEQPDGGMSGFLFWQPIKGQESGYGYWIVRITGEKGFITSI